MSDNTHKSYKSRWGMPSETVPDEPAVRKLKADERTTERKRAAMALGVNPDVVSRENDPAVTQKADQSQPSLADKIGLKSGTEKPSKSNALKQAFGDQAKR